MGGWDYHILPTRILHPILKIDLRAPPPGNVVLPMKFERWNEETGQFELVKMTPDEYEEMLINFSIVDVECQISDRIKFLKDIDGRSLETIDELMALCAKKIPKYD